MKKRAEILAPAGSPEALRAAVCNGADAVYLGYGDFNARRQARNFTEADLARAVDFCHKRGVRVYVTVNTIANDRELSEVEKICRDINRAGVDAAIIADLGVARLFREVAPSLPIHASTQMTVHNLAGVRALAEMGFSRVVLARELSKTEIKKICKESPIEIEVFVHGALCMCYSGQCEMSAIIGRRSGNRGLCAQPCRMQYKLGENASGGTYPLSLSDLCLADYVTELSDMGVASLKIEGRMKRAEYVATVTEVYSKILRERRIPTAEERRRLNDIFSRDGFTDGYYTENLGRNMFGIRTETDAPEELLARARKSYEDAPERPEEIDLYCIIEKDRPALLVAGDTKGNRVMVQGATPEPARTFPLTEESVKIQLEKTGGTCFVARDVNVLIGGGLSLPLSALNALRRECLEKLEACLGFVKDRPEGKFNSGFKLVNRKEKPRFTVSVLSVSQISEEMLSYPIEILYIPLSEFMGNVDRIKAIAERVRVCAALPRIIKDTETKEVEFLLGLAKQAGVEEASVGNFGHIELAARNGFTVRADFGINIANSHALREVRRQGAVSALLSPELTFPQIRDVSKIIDTEIFVYGRLPLMICENCVVKTQTGACVCTNPHALVDRTGASFPLVRDFGHRTVILNSQKLFLADKTADYRKLGLAYARLSFTTENVRECISVLDSYLGRSEYAPSVYTRGLYYRGVE
ncbi:MAG: U32 family peptidase [Oscillospiraceae bacterium]|nr:U32 family peptidase [Oscillospiraceae bacterium]